MQTTIKSKQTQMNIKYLNQVTPWWNTKTIPRNKHKKFNCLKTQFINNYYENDPNDANMMDLKLKIASKTLYDKVLQQNDAQDIKTEQMYNKLMETLLNTKIEIFGSTKKISSTFWIGYTKMKFTPNNKTNKKHK